MDAQVTPSGWRTWEISRKSRPEILGGRWDSMIAALHGDVTQTEAWIDYALATDYESALLIAQFDALGQPRIAAVGYVHAPHWPFSGLRVIRFPAYPCLERRYQDLLAAIEMCEKVARDNGCLQISFNSVGQPDAVSKTIPAGYAVETRLEYVFDLQVGFENLWAGVGRDQRRNVRVCERNGVRLARTDTREAMHTLRRLQADVNSRHEAKGDVYSLRPVAAYDALFDTVVSRGLARIYSATFADEVVMSALVTTYEGQARGIYNGASALGLKLRASTGLMWHIVETLAREGLSQMSLGAEDEAALDPSSQAHTLHEFKLRLGARLRQSSVATKELRPLALRSYEGLQKVSTATRRLRRQGT